jgi:hypothetical protein
VGDVVRLTHPQVISAGALGAVSRRYFVFGRAELLGDGAHEVRLHLADVGALYPGQAAYIAPAGVVSAWDGASKKITLTNDAFAGGDLATDADGFAAGDAVQLCDQYGTLREGGLIVAGVTGAAVTLTTTPSATPAAGDILRHAPWAGQTSAQRLLWASVAPSGSLGSDPGNDYGYLTG